LIASSVFAQTVQIVVGDIQLQGNKKTKDITILRELDFELGDTLSLNDLSERLKNNRDFVYNTELFNDVKVVLGEKLKDSSSRIRIEVVERWYWFAVPIFELADRNFNVWWTEQNRDFSRTKYGFTLLRQNMRGRNETLSLGFRWGYNRKILLDYDFPFIDQKKIYGLSLSAYYFSDREIGISTVDNKWQFVESDGFSNSRLSTGFTFKRRKEITNTHYFSTFFYRNSITDSLVLLNGNYYGSERKKQQYVSLEYSYEIDRRDVHRYPLNGFYFRGRLQKMGVGIFDDLNVLYGEMAFSKYQKINSRLYTGIHLKGKALLYGTLPYYNSSRIGFLENFVRGYEYYVIDAEHFGLAKWVLKYKLFSKKFKNPLISGDEFGVIPLQVFVKLHQEVGKAYGIEDPANPLNGSWLSGTGIGLDFYTFYDMLMTVDFTVNARGEKGIYLHFNLGWDYWKKR